MTAELPGGQFRRTPEAAKVLGVSRRTLYRRKAEGFFKLGEHYVTTGPSVTANLLWNVEAVQKVLGMWQGPRRKS